MSSKLFASFGSSSWARTTSVCGARHFVNHPWRNCRPRHNSAPSLHLPPAALRLDSLWLTPHMRLFSDLMRWFVYNLKSKTKKTPFWCLFCFGSSSWARTNDPAVNSRMLYRVCRIRPQPGQIYYTFFCNSLFLFSITYSIGNNNTFLSFIPP